MNHPTPSLDAWLREAKAHPSAPQIGMYLTHNGVVRQTARAKVRSGDSSAPDVVAMDFSHDPEAVEAAVRDTYKLDGIHYVRVWLNQGRLNVGDDLMYVLIGGDIRPHVVKALEYLVSRLKETCITETELPHPDT